MWVTKRWLCFAVFSFANGNVGSAFGIQGDIFKESIKMFSCAVK